MAVCTTNYRAVTSGNIKNWPQIQIEVYHRVQRTDYSENDKGTGIKQQRCRKSYEQNKTRQT